jgi:hypothetical protein
LQGRRAPRTRSTPRLGAERGAWSGLLSGRGNTCPYPQPPAGLAKDHTRVALTAQGVRYAVLAQVGTLEATPAFAALGRWPP